MTPEPSGRKEPEQRRITDAPAPVPAASVETQSEAEAAAKAIFALFKPHKTFRDAIQQDVMLSALEVQLVDTQAFQRLRRVKQLGATNLVFHSAVHSRFEHSIGTLAVAVKLLELIEKNPVPDLDVDAIVPHDRLMVRLCALLHDLAHIPYGHSLEDEGRLLLPQWRDSERVAMLLGPDSEVARVIHGNAELRDAARHDPMLEPEKIRDEVSRTLVAIERHTSSKLPKPFIADIVGNTVCADLLDYIVRDLTFLGLQDRPGDRFLSYLYLKRHGGKPRVVLRLSKPRGKEIRPDVQSEFVQLLRLRYSLAEKALYHHTKTAATSMIMSAVADMIINGPQGYGFRKSLYTMGDEDLIGELRNNGTPVARRLAESFRRRNIYKPLFLTKRCELGSPDFPGKNVWVEWFCGKGLRPEGMNDDADPEETERVGTEFAANRLTFERALEQILRLEPGDISLYCPPPRIGAKLARTLVEVQGVVGEAQDCLMPIPRKEVQSIREKHEDLWSLAVFGNIESVTPEKASICATEVARVLQGMNSPSELQEITARRYLDLYEDAFVEESGQPRLQDAEIAAVEQAATRGGPTDWLVTPNGKNFFWLTREAYKRRRPSRPKP